MIMRQSTAQVTEQLVKIRQQIDQLDLPISAFAGICFNHKRFYLSENSAVHQSHHQYHFSPENTNSFIHSRFRRHSKGHNLKFLACAFNQPQADDQIMSKLWLSDDIVPIASQRKQTNCQSDVQKLARVAQQSFQDNGVVKIDIAKNRLLNPAWLVTLADYKRKTPSSTFRKLLKEVKQFRGKTISFISATPQGGGVSIMRHALIRLYRLMGVKANWYVLTESPEAFQVTKTKFHNILQAVANKNIQLSNKDKEIYRGWIKDNAEIFSPVFKTSDVIVIDDPQPSGLVPFIKNINPKAKIIYRSHIQIESHLTNKSGTAQAKTWDFIWNNIKNCDLFISHPVEEFIPKQIPEEKTVLMPPTTDPLDGLNKSLTSGQMNYYLKLFNKLLLESNQTPLDLKRPYIIQNARFDPSKGIPDTIEAFSHLMKAYTIDDPQRPQLVIVGHSSVDDPDGIPIYNLTLNLIHENYPNLTDDIKVVRLPHIDQLSNTLVRKSKIVLQLSHKEGFEFKVTEALMKGRPVIAYRAGGIPLQIEHNKSGFLVDKVGDTTQVARHLHSLLSDKNLYQKMSQQARKLARKDLLTPTNALNWLFLANRVLADGDFEGNRRHINELINSSK